MPPRAELELFLRPEPVLPRDIGRVSRPPCLAVARFINLSSPEGDHFVAGLREEIISAVVRSGRTFVLAGASNSGVRPSPGIVSKHILDPRTDLVLEASVRRVGAHVRVVASVVDASDLRRLWTERFEDILAHEFALQDRIAAYLTNALEESLSLLSTTLPKPQFIDWQLSR